VLWGEFLIRPPYVGELKIRPTTDTGCLRVNARTAGFVCVSPSSYLSQKFPLTMSKHLQIVTGKQPGKTLSKEQKRFNTLVKKIKTLRAQIEKTKELDLELRRLGDERVKPAEMAAMAADRDWVMGLNNSLFRAKLGKKQAEKLERILLEEIGHLLNTHLYRDDAELQELYARYEGSGRSYAEIQDDEDQETKAMAAQMMNEMFGMDVEMDDLDNPESMQEKIKAKQAEFEAAEREHAEKRAKKVKTDSQRAAEEKRQAAETAVKRTAKQIYFDLVRHFHPDKEQDEQLREEKTEVMKQITAAYEADDHLRLLELQMTLLSGRDNVFADFNDTQLNYFNKTLQQQAAELEEELYLASPEVNGNIYAMLYAPDRRWMLANVEKHVRVQQKLVKDIRHNLKAIQQEKIFKAVIREYELEEDQDFFPDDFLR